MKGKLDGLGITRVSEVTHRLMYHPKVRSHITTESGNYTNVRARMRCDAHVHVHNCRHAGRRRTRNATCELSRMVQCTDRSTHTFACILLGNRTCEEN